MGRGEYGGGGARAVMAAVPGWLGRLVEESFFVACGAHESRKKNEKNIFCLDCCSSICPHCAPAHSHHPLLQCYISNYPRPRYLSLQSSPRVQGVFYNVVLLAEGHNCSVGSFPYFLGQYQCIPNGSQYFNELAQLLVNHHKLYKVRRYVYNDVVRLDDLEKLIDCSHMQPYTINSAKVVFLKPRPQSRPFKGSGNICLRCDRILQEPFHFCSLSCKVEHVVSRGEDLSSILIRFNESDFAFSHFENLRVDGSDLTEDVADGQFTPNSILEDPAQCNGSSASSTGGHETGTGSEAPRKKKSTGGGFFPQIVLSSLSNRRKGAPHRSPLS